MDAQWSDDFHHAVHVALTGEKRRLLRGIREARRHRSPSRTRSRIASSSAGSTRRTANATTARRQTMCRRSTSSSPIQNHDQVGNRAAGERLGALVAPDALQARGVAAAARAVRADAVHGRGVRRAVAISVLREPLRSRSRRRRARGPARGVRVVRMGGRRPRSAIGGDVLALAHPLRALERGRARRAPRDVSRAARDPARGAGAAPRCRAHHRCKRAAKHAGSRCDSMRPAPEASSRCSISPRPRRASPCGTIPAKTNNGSSGSPRNRTSLQATKAIAGVQFVNLPRGFGGAFLPSTSTDMRVWPGQPYPLGATWDGEGVNFALFSENATGVELCLFDAHGDAKERERIPIVERSDQVWHCYLPDVRPGQLYGYRVHGPYAPEEGHRFNPNQLLIDPYAKAITGAIKWSDALFAYQVGSDREDLEPDPADSAGGMPKCVVVDPAFTWGNDRRRARRGIARSSTRPREGDDDSAPRRPRGASRHVPRALLRCDDRLSQVARRHRARAAARAPVRRRPRTSPSGGSRTTGATTRSASSRPTCATP